MGERKLVRSKQAEKNVCVRCAIYTRKSTEEGLDQDFNSLQAQREAAEAFIQSQKHLGACPSILQTSRVQTEQNRYIMFYAKRLPHIPAGTRAAVAAEPARMAS